MTERTVRGQVAVAGVGESAYYKRGQSPEPEIKLGLHAILAACEDAGISPKEIDGFCSFSDDRNDPTRLAAALGVPELRLSVMQWGGGGGGTAGAIGNAAASIHAGYADVVVVYRALAQGQFGRFGQGAPVPHVQGDRALSVPYGLMSPAQMFAMKVVRFMHDHEIDGETLRAISMASYHHAQNNPRAVMYGRPLTEEKYDSSRWIIEPHFHLYDCCMENDGAAAMVLVSAERAKDLAKQPVYLLGAAQGSGHRAGAGAHNATDYGSSNFTTLVPHLYEQARVKPSDIDVAQVYENFTGGVLMTMIEHGICSAEQANDFFQLENLLAPSGKFPLNTSGGNLAECYVHGMGLQVEAVRQLRGESVNQVADAKVALAAAGPMVSPVSTCIYGTEEVL
ncbi:MAG: acetyl-CoA acetyltransferase [Pseudomonadota bacterium]|nr:acetyl-CoA acetyltransferase [Pseudomonadota bacterium]